MPTPHTAPDATDPDPDPSLGFERLFPSLNSLLSTHEAAKRAGISLVYTTEELHSARDIGEKAEAELHSMRELMRRLTERSASYEEAFKVHDSAMAPIKRIPTELLERILLASLGIPNRGEEVLSLDVHLHYDKVTQTTGGVWALREVCHQWKVLVESSPRMWTSLYIDFGPPTLPSLDLVKTYLERSGTQP
jgi:hypothetical protein